MAEPDKPAQQKPDEKPEKPVLDPGREPGSGTEPEAGSGFGAGFGSNFGSDFGSGFGAGFGSEPGPGAEPGPRSEFASEPTQGAEPDFFAGPYASPRVEIPPYIEPEPGSAGFQPASDAVNSDPTSDPRNTASNSGSTVRSAPDGAPGGSPASKLDEGSASKSEDTADGASSFDERTSGSKLNSLPLKAELPPFLKMLLQNYVQITISLFRSPIKFFAALDTGPGFKEAAYFLAISSVGNALLTALFKMNLLVIPKIVLSEMTACVLVSGVVCLLAQGMGSKTNFPTCFRMFAYLTCLNLLSPIPGMNFICPVASIVLTFFGLKEVLKVSIYQTCIIMFLASFMQVILAIGRMF